MSHKNLKDKILEYVAIFVGKRPYFILIISVLLALLSVYYTIHNLHFLTNRNDLISPDTQYYQNFENYRKEFKNFDGLVIAVEGNDKQQVKYFVKDLANHFLSNPENFQDVFYKIDTDFLKDKKLLFLSLEDLYTLETKINSNRIFISNLILEPGLEPFFIQVNKEISKAMVGSLISDFFGGGGGEGKNKKEPENPLDLSLLESILEQMLEYLKGVKIFSSPWINIFIKEKSGIDEDGYLTTDGKKFYFVLTNPAESRSEFAKAVGPIKKARNYIQELQKKYPGVTAGVTGSTALASDEMITSKNDTVIASLIALTGVSILLITSLKGFTLPFIAVFTLIISLCWSLGFTTLTIGHLNILSVVFTTILIGLGIDFGIHFIMRYQEEMASRNNINESITKSFVGTGKGVIAGAITTSFAFMTAIFADFKGIAELGFIAGTGIIICLIATLTLLPALIIIVHQLTTGKTGTGLQKKSMFNYEISKAFHPFIDILLKKPRHLIFLSLIVTLLSISAIKNIRFDYNILNLQAFGTESVDYEIKILNNSNQSAWYGAVVVNTFNEVLSTKKNLESLSSVKTVNSISSIIPQQQEEKIGIIKNISLFFKTFPQIAQNSDSLNLDKLSDVLNKIRFKMRDESKDKWEPGAKPLSDSIKNVRQLIADFNFLVKQKEKTSIEKDLNNYQIILFTDFSKKIKSFMESLTPTAIKIKDIPKDLTERFIGKTGKFLLQVFPTTNIYDRKPMEKFISDIWSIDPNATGTAITASESSRLMKEGYIKGGLYALIAIIVFVWLSFKDWSCTLLAILPLVLGAIWTLGLMGLFGLKFNLANLIILPLIIGIGVDNGIHIVHRYRDDRGCTVSPVYKSTGKSVFLSSMTTIIGFGSLMVASHRGIHSIGVLLTIGVGCCMVASLTVLPAILKIAREKGWEPKSNLI